MHLMFFNLYVQLLKIVSNDKAHDDKHVLADFFMNTLII